MGVRGRRIWQARAVLTVPVRQLGEAERARSSGSSTPTPIAAAQVAERVAAHGLAWWRADGRIFGYGRAGTSSRCAGSAAT